ncbi:MAG: ABC-type transport auxiliary lipoprotein family protein [Steroidobacteraceae bacterium]
MRTLVLVTGVALLLSGCSLFRSNAKPEQSYVLRPAAAPAAARPAPVGVQLLRPAVEPGLDSTRIALSRPGNRLDYFAVARWTGTLGEVWQSLASQRFRASGAFATVDTDRGGFGATYVVAITVRRFEAEYGADEQAAPTARVLLEVTVGDRSTRTTLASFDVTTESPATANRQGAVVEALERAANDAITQVIERSAGALADKR